MRNAWFSVQLANPETRSGRLWAAAAALEQATRGNQHFEADPTYVRMAAECLWFCCREIALLHRRRRRETPGSFHNPFAMARRDVAERLSLLADSAGAAARLLRDPMVRFALEKTLLPAAPAKDGTANPAFRKVETREWLGLDALALWARQASEDVPLTRGKDNYIEAVLVSDNQITALCVCIITAGMATRRASAPAYGFPVQTTQGLFRRGFPGSTNQTVATAADYLLEAATGIPPTEKAGRDWPKALREVTAGKAIPHPALPWEQLLPVKMRIEDIVCARCAISIVEDVE